MSRQRGFTLIEIVLVVTIILMMLVLAVPSFTGLAADRRLRHSLDDFGNVVRAAHDRSVAERRSYLVVFNGKKFQVRPEAMAKEDKEDKEEEEPAGVTNFTLSSAGSIKISFPAALRKNPPGEWIFWPTGTCEPAIIEFNGRDGTWTARYSGLAAEPRLTSYAAK